MIMAQELVLVIADIDASSSGNLDDQSHSSRSTAHGES